jgi:hypothetical protein
MGGRTYLRPFEDPLAVGENAVCTDAERRLQRATQAKEVSAGVLPGDLVCSTDALVGGTVGPKIPSGSRYHKLH